MRTVVDNLDDLSTLIGTALGPSPWLDVDQNRINTFADATGDHQWIHTDVERARNGPFGGTIAHGYLTLSLVIPLWASLLTVHRASAGVNYGLNRVRFPSPVLSGAKIRMTATILAVEAVEGGVQVTADAVIEQDGVDKPACVAQPIFRYYR